MKKLTISIFMAFLGIFAFGQINQSDYYGTWVGSYANGNDVFIVNTRITASVFNMIINGVDENNAENELLRQEENITRWISTANGNPDFRSEFQNGFILRTQSAEYGLTTIVLFQSNDKKYIYFPDITANGVPIIFAKQ